VRIIILFLALASLAGCKDDTDYTVIGTQGMQKAISVPVARATDTEHYQQIIEKECPRSGLCILSFFTELSSVSYPLSDSAIAAKTGQYNRNPKSNLDRLLLACRLGDFPPDKCF
jgi:hypothetical protein